MENKIVIDAKNTILGRLCSYTAKQALLGKEIVIVNCNDILVAGNRKDILGKYLNLRQMDSSNLRGPILPKVPEKIVKRTLRGMLSYKQQRGEKALDRVMCYNKVPAELESSKKIVLSQFSADKMKAKTMKMSEIARLI